jgi:flagellar motility protein MotE (MotC chaperone)
MYFFGKAEDKEKAHTIVNETKDLGKSVGDFIKRQKDNYDNGSFDSLFLKIRNSVDKFKGKTEKKSDEEQQDLRELEKQLKQIDPNKLSEKNREELKKLLQDLEKELN